MIFSDGLVVGTIRELHRHFHGRVHVSFGWGTLLTNDFRGLAPRRRLDPFSLVCKVVTADGNPTVKLSDNPAKATRSEEHTSELQSRGHLVCRLLLEKKNT